MRRIETLITLIAFQFYGWFLWHFGTASVLRDLRLSWWGLSISPPIATVVGLEMVDRRGFGHNRRAHKRVLCSPVQAAVFPFVERCASAQHRAGQDRRRQSSRNMIEPNESADVYRSRRGIHPLRVHLRR